MIPTDAVWLITGCSKRLRRAIAEAVLDAGYHGVVTARNTDEIKDFQTLFSDRALALALDITKPDQVKSAIAAAEEHFGRIDVLVNNAGYGYIGGVEEGEDKDIRASFETNFYGPWQ